MIEKICHIGPALYVQGRISSVLVSYKKLFKLPEGNFIASYNGSFVKSLPVLFLLCLRLLICPPSQFDFFQIHTSSYGSFFRKYLISRCLRLRGRKYVCHIHGSLFDKFCNGAPSIVKLMLKDYFVHSEKIFILSSEMKDIVRSVSPSSENFVVIPNPGESIAGAPEDLSLHENPVKVIFSGRFGNRKGVYDLIEAFDKSSFSVPVELFLFGDGEVDKVRECVEKSSKSSLISVSPWMKHGDYIRQLPKYDLLVLPSYAERFSMSLVEALGFGLPVISTFVGGTAEVVEDGVCGILCEPGDILALTKALETIVNDKALRLKMGKAGWERASTHFTGDVVKGCLERGYQDLLS